MTLREFFEENPRVALGFSGGVDSSYLLYAGRHYGADIKPYYIKTAFQPQFELEDAIRMAKSLGTQLTILETDILKNADVVKNSPQRCYYCKNALFGLLRERAAADGYTVCIDGTNASDDAADRPGMQALRDMKVLSPLQACGITKEEVRRLSREAGLFTWDKPAYACLATRVPADTAITAEALSKIERAEEALLALGFSDFRVRMLQGAARLQLPEGQFERAMGMRREILHALLGDFQAVLLDLMPRS